jgi:GNAT superfamily N-acetyltransferase
VIVPSHTVRRATAADAPTIQTLLATDPEYFPRVEGAPLRADEALIILDERPPDFPLERKHVFLVDDVALLDMLEGYPDARTWFLGLIFLAAHARGRGLGTRLVEATCDHARTHGAAALRLAVATTNPGAERLYKRLGFRFVARRQRTVFTGAVIDLLLLERAL